MYQFHGCWYHGHDCVLNASEDARADSRPRNCVYKRSRAGSTCVSWAIVHWEYDWHQRIGDDADIRRFLGVLFRSLYPRRPDATLAQVVERVRSGSFYGLIECDVSVPDSLRHRFSEMTPIFKTSSVGREHMGEDMRKLSERVGYLARPSKMLVGSMRGEHILLFSGLTRWYLEHGLEITEVYQFIEYTSRDLF